MSLLRERRRCPLKSWGPSGGNDFWGNPQEGVVVFPNLGAVYLIEGVWVRTKIIRSVPTPPPIRDGAAPVPLRATSHTPVPPWLMGMKANVQAAEYTPSERGFDLALPYSKLSGVPKKYRSEAPTSHSPIRSYSGSPKSTAGRFAPEDTFWGYFWGKSRSPCRGGRGIGRTAKVRVSRYSAAGVKSIALPQ